MSYILIIWGVISGFYGVLVLSQAKSAIHEIEVGVAFLIATVAIGLGGVIEAVDHLRKSLQKPREAETTPGRHENAQDTLTRKVVESYTRR